MPSGKKLPKEVVEHWPEVLKDIKIDVIPVDYVHSVIITFVDGRVWEIDTSKNDEVTDFSEALEELMVEYEDVITNVDFRLDTKRVKEDITKRTKRFLKKRK